MKILYVSDTLGCGGAEKLFNDFLPILIEQHTIDVLVLTGEKAKYIQPLRAQGVSVNVIPGDIRGHLARINYIARFIKKGNYDVVHANLFPVVYYCSLIGRMWPQRKFALVMTEHSTHNRRRDRVYLRPLERFIYGEYDHIISISDKAQDSLLRWLRLPAGDMKFSVVPNGILLDEFCGADSYQREQLVPELQKEDTCLLMVGRFNEQKNHAFMVEVMAELPESYHLLLLGEGSLRPQMEQKVDSLGLKQRVHFLGFRSDVAQVMKSVDLIVIPSRWEGFGLVAAEALACGMPIVASNVPGLSEVVGDMGEKVQVNDKNGFAQAILRLSQHKSTREDIEQRKQYAQQFDIRTMAQRYVDIYKRTLNRRDEV